MTATVTPFRRVQDAHAALVASGYARAEGDAWEAAVAAAEGYQRTPEEEVEFSADVTARAYERVAEGDDSHDALTMLRISAQFLADAVRALQEARR